MVRQKRAAKRGGSRHAPNRPRIARASPRAAPSHTPASDAAPPLVIGIGASAGGLNAFRAFFAKMPPSSGMVFVLVQHLDPQHDSMLVELLGTHTKMAVVQAKDDMAIAADHVFIIPPDAVLTIHDGILRVATPAPPRQHRRPIDTFFASLAEDQGENAVCIILSGSGSDGTQGLKAIKEHGGLILAQAGIDETALLGMPSSAAATGLVDCVMPVEDMPAKLIDYQQHLRRVVDHKDPDGTRRDAAEHLAKINALLRTRIGHDFSGYKDKTLIRRIQRRMQVLQIDSVPAYIEHLRKRPSQLDLLFRDFLIGVTQFFRDPEAFAVLEREILPKILESKRANDQIRIWVPGCATGEEVYSIAILLKEAMARHEVAVPVQLFATDLDGHAIEIARHGRYRKTLSGMAPARLAQWFVEEGEDYCPRKDIREMCVFSVHNVLRDPPFSKLDLISCRNLMIYLNGDIQKRLLRTFHYGLRPGGYLFLGTSESVSQNAGLFAGLDKKHRLYQRRGEISASLPAVATSGVTGTVGPARSAAAKAVSPSMDRIDQYARRTLEKYSPVYVVINRGLEVVRFSGHTGDYIDPSPGAPSFSLFSILRKDLQSVARPAVQKALATRQPVVTEELSAAIDGISRRIALIVEPIAESDGTELYVVAFQDRGPTRGKATSGVDSHDLEEELSRAQVQLQSMIDDLETANEELKSTNEEYQSVNEELQSTNEELETTKEELTSINEELQTVNSELNGKNEALNRANSDLKNLLDSTHIATLFLDNELRIKNFTPALSDIFPVRDSDRGRPITDIVTRLSYDDLRRDVRKVLRTLSVIEHEVTGMDDGMYFIMKIRPYRTLDDVIDGVVITLVDISERKRHERERAGLAAIVESSQDAVIGTDLDGTVTSWNRGAEQLFGYRAEEILGKAAALLIASDRDDEEPQLLERIGRGEKIDHYETVRRRKDGSAVDISLSVSPVRDAGGRIVGTSKVSHDVSERKRADAVQRLMVDELNHRVKNTLATVQSIAARSLKGALSAEKLDTFFSRLVALSRTHDLLAQDKWEGVSLRDLLVQELDPYRSEESPRFVVVGPDFDLRPKAALALGLVFHELATNAAKYGALSTPTGQVRVVWDVLTAPTSDVLQLAWTETGGPTVEKTTDRGFGLALIERGLSHELDSKVDLHFNRTGLSCTFEIPLAAARGSTDAVK